MGGNTFSDISFYWPQEQESFLCNVNFQKKVVFVKDPNVHYVHSTAQSEDAKVDGNNLTKKLDFSADTEFWGWASPPEAVSPSPWGELSSPILPLLSDIIQWAGMEMEILVGRKSRVTGVW